ALEGAREQLDAAQHANLVAAVRAGVRVGEACPVCGAKVTALPKAGRAPALEKAKASLEKAEALAEAAGGELEEARTARDTAERDLKEARREHQRLQAELERRRGPPRSGERFRRTRWPPCRSVSRCSSGSKRPLARRPGPRRRRRTRHRTPIAGGTASPPTSRRSAGGWAASRSPG